MSGKKINEHMMLQDAGWSNEKWPVWRDEMEGTGQDTLEKGHKSSVVQNT